MDDVISPAQFRAARAMLNWSLMELAGAAGVSVSAVHGLEGRYPRLVPPGSVGAIRVALETAGVRFLKTEDDYVGVVVQVR